MKKRSERYDLHFGEEASQTTLRKDKKSGKGDDSYYYMGFFSQMGIGIAFPIAVGAIAGSWFDKTYGTHPRAVLTGIAIGFFLSLVYFVRTIKDVLTEFNS